MNPENSMPQASLATLSEQELFAEFLQSKIIERSKRGKELYRHAVEDLLYFTGDYLEFDLMPAPDDEGPSVHLELLENELLGALANIRLVSKAFDELRDERIIDNDWRRERYARHEREAA